MRITCFGWLHTPAQGRAVGQNSTGMSAACCNMRKDEVSTHGHWSVSVSGISYPQLAKSVVPCVTGRQHTPSRLGRKE